MNFDMDLSNISLLLSKTFNSANTIDQKSAEDQLMKLSQIDNFQMIKSLSNIMTEKGIQGKIYNLSYFFIYKIGNIKTSASTFIHKLIRNGFYTNSTTFNLETKFNISILLFNVLISDVPNIKIKINVHESLSYLISEDNGKLINMSY